MKSLFVLAMLFTATLGFSSADSTNLLDGQVKEGMDITSSHNAMTDCSDLQNQDFNLSEGGKGKGKGTTRN